MPNAPAQYLLEVGQLIQVSLYGLMTTSWIRIFAAMRSSITLRRISTYFCYKIVLTKWRSFCGIVWGLFSFIWPSYAFHLKCIYRLFIRCCRYNYLLLINGGSVMPLLKLMLLMLMLLYKIREWIKNIHQVAQYILCIYCST